MGDQTTYGSALACWAGAHVSLASIWIKRATDTLGPDATNEERLKNWHFIQGLLEIARAAALIARSEKHPEGPDGDDPGEAFDASMAWCKADEVPE